MVIVSCTLMLCVVPDVAGDTFEPDTGHMFPAFKVLCTGIIQGWSSSVASENIMSAIMSLTLQ